MVRTSLIIASMGFCFTILPPAENDPCIQLLLQWRGYEQAEALVQGTLTTLDLAACSIEFEGAQVVAETVTDVHMHVNQIRASGTKAICEALWHNKTVRGLKLSDNPIQEGEGDAPMLELFEHNVCIIQFWAFRSHISPESMASLEFLSERRNKVLIPDVVRHASLFLIGIRCSSPGLGMGDLAILPKELVKMIAMEVWASRRDPKWIQALSDEEYAQRHEDFVDHWVRHNDY